MLGENKRKKNIFAILFMILHEFHSLSLKFAFPFLST